MSESALLGYIYSGLCDSQGFIGNYLGPDIIEPTSSSKKHVGSSLK